MTYKDIMDHIKLRNFRNEDGTFNKRKFKKIKRMSEKYANSLLKPIIGNSLDGRYTGFKGKLTLAKHALRNLPDFIRANRIKRRVNKLMDKYIDKVDNR